MEEPEGDERSDLATWGGLLAVIVLVGLAVWLLIAFKHSSDTLDCVAQGRHNCLPMQ